MNKKEREQKEAVDTLKQWGLVDGSTVYAKVNHVSSSGMSRNIALYMSKDGEIIDISYHAARALQWGFKDGYNGGVKVSGVGMDMMFHTVYSLSYAMGYGSLNQEQHDMHRKYKDEKKDCIECEIDQAESRGIPAVEIMNGRTIGLKYRQL